MTKERKPQRRNFGARMTATENWEKGLRSAAPQQYRPYVTLRTPLSNIPTEWWRVEPKIYRPRSSHCWLWTGWHLRQHDDRPVIRVEGKTFYVHRWVASIFWRVTNSTLIRQSCRNVNCINPAHFTFWTRAKKDEAVSNE